MNPWHYLTRKKIALVSGRIPSAKQSYDPTRRWDIPSPPAIVPLGLCTSPHHLSTSTILVQRTFLFDTLRFIFAYIPGTLSDTKVGRAPLQFTRCH